MRELRLKDNKIYACVFYRDKLYMIRSIRSLSRIEIPFHKYSDGRRQTYMIMISSTANKKILLVKTLFD